MLRLTRNPSQENDVYRCIDSSISHHDFYFEENKKTLGKVLSSLPSANLKRKFSIDGGDLQNLDVPSKIPRKGLLQPFTCCPFWFFVIAAVFILEEKTYDFC